MSVSFGVFGVFGILDILLLLCLLCFSLYCLLGLGLGGGVGSRDLGTTIIILVVSHVGWWWGNLIDLRLVVGILDRVSFNGQFLAGLKVEPLVASFDLRSRKEVLHGLGSVGVGALGRAIGLHPKEVLKGKADATLLSVGGTGRTFVGDGRVHVTVAGMREVVVHGLLETGRAEIGIGTLAFLDGKDFFYAEGSGDS
ncbi:MAG: hypothetical protein JOS17DRAFT_762639 [Linnemannia elongata]|nr:MAG: hypothetical protein JOS17DRAFT_762639 [Linnemannia elongata]